MPGHSFLRGESPCLPERRLARTPVACTTLRLPMLFLGLGGLLLFPGGAPAGEHANSASGPIAAGTPRRGGRLVYVQERGASLDPRDAADVYASTVVYQVHRGLLQFSPNLTPVPGLARTWTISRDGLTYTFELHPDALFHNGRAVTADDVRYSLERIYEPGLELGIAGQSLTMIDGVLAYHRGQARRVSGIEVVGPHTLRIRLNRPTGTLLWSLAMAQAAVVPRDVVERSGAVEFGRNPIGCGPFRFVTSEAGRVRLAAFDKFYRGRANLDSLILVTPPMNAAAVGVDMLLKGQASMAEIPGYRRKELAGQAGFRLISGRELSLSFIGLNCRKPPLDNLHVRRALACAADRLTILRANPEGRSIPTGILPPGMSCYSPDKKILPFDPARAREELALAGHPGGRGLPELRLVSSRSAARSRLADSLLVAGWRSVGIPVRLEYVDWTTLAKGVENRSLPLFSLSWVADLPDPDSFMGSLFSSNSTYNYFAYHHGGVDSLLQRGRELVDPRMRQGVYRAIEKQVLEDVALVPLFNNIVAFGVQQQVHGIELTPLGISYVDFSRAWVEGGSGDHAEFE